MIFFRYIIVVAIFACCTVQQVFAWEYFDDSVITNSGIDEYCNLEDGVVSCGDYQQEYARLDKKVSHLFSALKSMNTIQRDRLLQQFPKAYTILGSLSVTKSGTKVGFQATFVHSVFLDMQHYFEYRSRLLNLPKTLQGLHTDSSFSKQQKHDRIRRYIIHFFLQTGFDNFVQKPFAGESVVIETAHDDWKKYTMKTTILSFDRLDTKINSWLSGSGEESLYIDHEEFAVGEPIQLFKSQEDLESLGYEVVSHRLRISEDKDYRRNNVSKSYSYIGRVRVINPGESISFLKESKFDPNDERHYEVGKIIFLDEEIEGYGGGLCGGSTSLFQGSIYNKGLKIQSRNHSKWYDSLYSAKINGEYITTPGLDSTIYSPSLDLIMTNITTHPIILVSNYDGTYGAGEEIFTLGFPQDIGTVEYIKKRSKKYKLQTKDGSTRSSNGSCYEREIHGESVVRCYKEVF